jgi:drug/metabolite transporter (DMT)-like permease
MIKLHSSQRDPALPVPPRARLDLPWRVAHRCRQLASRLSDQRSAVCVAAIVLASRYTDRDVDATAGNLDWLGGALVTAALGHATWALTEGSGRAWSPTTFVVLGTGSIFSLLFLSVERRLGDRAMIPLSLFGSPSFVGLTLLALGSSIRPSKPLA